MAPYALRNDPSEEDDSWRFTLPEQELGKPKRSKPNVIYGKMLKFTVHAITLEIAQLPNNRILQDDDPSKFILASFSGLRFPDAGAKATKEYINRLMKAGFFLNNVQYRFYHHSNSQLRSRSCFLRQANTDAELDARIYQLGQFKTMMNIAKRAKRIGLLFSEAEVDYSLNPTYTEDIPDIKCEDEVMSDGCGLISRRLAFQVSRAKNVMFRDRRYTPSVYQIRYLGYKGVLMLHPPLDEEKKLVQFRQSMKKFTTTAKNHTFSVVDYSKPYAFGRLNNDIIVLLSSLGITNDTLLRKQQEYLDWIAGASRNVPQAVDFLSCLAQYSLVERVLLDGLDNHGVLEQLRSYQLREVSKFRGENNKPKARMIIHKSRLLFGVCDPFQVLREGEVFLRMTVGRRGETTAINGDVLVVRNPCLHPGDCLKLRAVDNSCLSHLVDCIVFATVAKAGHRSAPAMSSGGDLDGDKYFVCWDADLVPARISEAYDYPPNREHVSKEVTRAYLANHFASYNSSGLARIADLHGKWVRAKGALSPECQELNALHSHSVDGADVKIPERLRTPNVISTEPFILDMLANAAQEFATAFVASAENQISFAKVDAEDGEKILAQLLGSTQNAVSEYELFIVAFRLATRYRLDFRPYLLHLDFGALKAAEKEALVVTMRGQAGPEQPSQLNIQYEEHPYIWNSLVQSDILTPQDLYQKDLNRPYSLQRLYSSKLHGLATFFRYLRLAAQDFTRRLLIIKTDDRFTVGIFMRGEIPWDEDPEVAQNVVVCPFLPHTSLQLATYKPCTQGYRLHCGDNNFQLYDRRTTNTFVFINRPPALSAAEVTTSIALQKISKSVQKQIGRVNKTPVAAIELHVVSNRDRIAHQLFDLWFDHVPTEEYIKRSAQTIAPYERNNLKHVDWTLHPDWLKNVFVREQDVNALQGELSCLRPEQCDKIMDFAFQHHADAELFATFHALIKGPHNWNTLVLKWIDREPQLVFALLKAFPPNGSRHLPDETTSLAHYIVRNIIRSANQLGLASLVALEKIAGSVADISLPEYLGLLTLVSLSVRPPQLVQEILLVLHDSRAEATARQSVSEYVHKHALAVAFELAEEAAEECPCDENGKIKRPRIAPATVKLLPHPEKPNHVKALVRIDLKTSVRLHSHIRLRAASKPEKEWVEAHIMDGVVVQAMKGELQVELLHTPPPEMASMDWKMFNAGVIANSQAMMDALLRFAVEGTACCRFHDLIIDSPIPPSVSVPSSPVLVDRPLSRGESHLNPSQIAALRSCQAPLSLIWGPPGTGKTETVVHILRRIIVSMVDDSKVLMTASTHNAVDNILKRFIGINENEGLLREDQILRVATDLSKVNKSLQHFTIDARIGGDMNENNRLFKQAQERVQSASIVFTTCAGSGLGILRKADFDIVLIDEASQITEPCALIPLVKGCRNAIIVGDHKQLRPTVRRMGEVLRYDVSLLERLYTGTLKPGMRRTMLDVQYRFPRELADFPSREFYQSELQTGIQDTAQVLAPLDHSSFPWPKRHGVIFPVVFVQCSAEEDTGSQSKSNTDQAALVESIISKLNEDGNQLKVTALTPYKKQVKAIQAIHVPVDCFTIDSFQGRESDIVIFSTVRCNTECDIGFLGDERRLNVMWTRAKLALIIVGDRKTLTSKSDLWRRAIGSCMETNL